MCVPPLLLWAFWGVGDRISLQAGSNLLHSPAWYQLTIPLTQPLECWDYRCELLCPTTGSFTKNMSLEQKNHKNFNFF